MLEGQHHTNIKKLFSITAFCLPPLLYLSGVLLFSVGLQPSFSLYYYTPVQDIFVGLLFILGTLIYIDHPHYAEKGYLAKVAGILAFAIALLPTKPLETDSQNIIFLLHSLSALVFFALLAIISLTVFVGESLTTGNKKIYKTCGYTILLVLGLFILLRLSPTEIQKTLQNINIIFWLETVATWAFAFAWFTRSKEHANDYHQ